MFNKKMFIAAVLLAGQPLLHAAEFEPALVPTPRANALETSASSRPFLAAVRAQQPVNLAVRGYVEKEHLVRGLAGNSKPYVTRLLVRRPLDAGRFSGRVIVEILHAAAQQETAPLWSLSWEHFLRRGDGWVGVTVSPAAASALRDLNAARYVALSLPAGDAGGCDAARSVSAAGDVVAQVGALLRSSSKENPLLEVIPQRLLLAGQADSGDAVARFATGAHRALRLGNGEPIFDGYLNVSGPVALTPDCAAALPRSVPFVTVLTGAETGLEPQSAGGAQSEGLRVLEISGVLASAGAACREPLMDQALARSLNAVWQQLDDWLVLKQPMATGVPGFQIPGMQRAGAGGQQVCNVATGSLRFDLPSLRREYRTRAEYLRRFGAAVEQAVLDRLLVKEDADALKATVAKVLPAF